MPDLTVVYFSPNGPIERYSCKMPSPLLEGDIELLAHYVRQSVGPVKCVSSIQEMG